MRLLPALCALGVLACAPPPDQAGAAPAETFADTLRGTLRIAGSEPVTTVMLAPAGGAEVALEGERALLETLDGLEVRVAGERTEPGRFRVGRVDVRAANGIPAVDGRLAREGGRDVLVLRDGTRTVVARLPHALRGRPGAWVWLAGPLDGDIDSFGIIADRQ